MLKALSGALALAILLFPYSVSGQSCANNWLYLPASPYSSVQLGDLDVPGTQITVEAEFCRTTPYSGGPLYAGDLVSKHEDPNTVNYLLRPNDAEITTSDGYFQTPPVCDIALNTTYHVAMTYDGAMLRFYRNGVLVSQIAATGTLVQQDIPTEIGFYYFQVHPTNFVGYINEVRIWNVVRTQGQIQANMNTSLPSPTTQTGLLAYYTFGSLTNLQGTAAWDGTTVGAPLINQTNPYCNSVIQASASFSLTLPVLQQTVCEGSPSTLYGYYSGGVTASQYLWQISQDSGKTWTDLPNSNTLRYDVSAPQVNQVIDYYFRVVAIDGSGNPGTACQVISAPAILTVTPGLDADFSFTQDICNPLQVGFAGASQSGVSYTWTIGGIVYSSPNPGDATLQHTFTSFGAYPVTLTTSGTVCAGSSTKSINIGVQQADIISTADTTVCAGKAVVLRTLPSIDFCWSPTSYLDNPASANPSASPPVTTKYFFTAKTTGANLIPNGDFESGNTGFTSAYQYTSNGIPEATYFVGTDPHTWNPGAPSGCGDHTTGSGKMMIINGALVTGVSVWTAGPFTVTPNTNYAFSIWIQSVSPLAPAILQFSINGTSLGNPVNANANTCVWNQFYTTWNSGNSTTAIISLVNNNTALSGNDFALDDISFAPVIMQIDSVTIAVETPSVSTSPADTIVCPGVAIPLHATGSLNYSWSPGTGVSDPGIANPIVIIPTPGTTTAYTVTGTSARGCIATATTNVTIYPHLMTISPDTLVCKGDPAQLHSSGGGVYSWSPSGLLDNAASPDPRARPDTTTRFTLTLTDANQCAERDSVTVRVKSVPLFHAPPDESVCNGYSVPLNSSNPSGYFYDWSPSSGLDDPSAPTPIATPAGDITYRLHIRDSLCTAYDSSFSVAVTVLPNPVITAEKENDIDCAIHLALLTATGGVSYVWTPFTGLSDPFSATPVASIDSTVTYIVKGTAGNGCYAYDTLTVKVSAMGANTFVVPNAFTPNGDGHNDCFGITRWGDVQLEEMDIFNRMGLRVFTTRNASDCWDGTYNGQPQPTGGYVYVIRAHSFCGAITRTGTVMLIR